MLALATGASAVDGRAGIAADAGYGEYLAAECITCHHAEGSGGTAPALRSLSYRNLVAALKEYRNGVRRNAAMQSVARSLGDREIEALAAYLSDRP